jgi:hypothetical protein
MSPNTLVFLRFESVLKHICDAAKNDDATGSFQFQIAKEEQEAVIDGVVNAFNKKNATNYDRRVLQVCDRNELDNLAQKHKVGGL